MSSDEEGWTTVKAERKKKRPTSQDHAGASGQSSSPSHLHLACQSLGQTSFCRDYTPSCKSEVDIAWRAYNSKCDLCKHKYDFTTVKKSKNSTCRNKNCEYAHDKASLERGILPCEYAYDVSTAKERASGCKHGDKCNFAHDLVERDKNREERRSSRRPPTQPRTPPRLGEWLQIDPETCSAATDATEEGDDEDTETPASTRSETSTDRTSVSTETSVKEIPHLPFPPAAAESCALLPETAVPTSSQVPVFVAALRFDGPRLGMEFKTGDRGVGYYKAVLIHPAGHDEYPSVNPMPMPQPTHVVDGLNVIRYFGGWDWSLLVELMLCLRSQPFCRIIVILSFGAASSPEGQAFIRDWPHCVTRVKSNHDLDKSDDKPVLQCANTIIAHGKEHVRVWTNDDYQDHGVPREWLRMWTVGYGFTPEKELTHQMNHEVFGHH